MKILEAIQIRGLRLHNRLVMPAMCTNLAASDGTVSDRLIQYYVERAQGGVGLVITGNAYVDIGGKSQPNQYGLDDRNKLPGLRRLTDAVHEQGGLICAQLNHGGRNSIRAITGRTPVAPSPIPSFRYVDGDPPRELQVSEIQTLAESFAQAACLAKEAGFDAVEIHAAHGYLISQFISSYTNYRSNEYGDGLEGRLLFLRKVLRNARNELGQDYPILVRISAEEFVPGGHTINEAKKVALAVQEEGGDVVDVSTGQGPSSPKDRDYQALRNQTIPPMDFPLGLWVPYAEQIKSCLNIPVMAVGRISDPELAESILENGQADLVAMGRALIADPDLPHKFFEGRAAEIRPCLSCNQGCAGRIFNLKDVECLVNPQAGHESERKLQKATESKRILVAGGGPGGMEAARVAALRGHKVSLWERSNRLGGQLHLIARLPKREPFGWYSTYLASEIKRLGVDIQLGLEATAEAIFKFDPDAAIIATGAKTLPLGLKKDGTVELADAWKVILHDEYCYGPAVVVGAGAVGLETAELLVSRGAAVSIVEMQSEVGADIVPGIRTLLLGRLAEAGVSIHLSTKAVRILPEGLEVEVNKRSWVIPAALVVSAVGAQSEDQLSNDLSKAGFPVITIGDALSPRKAYEAVHEGFLAAYKL